MSNRSAILDQRNRWVKEFEEDNGPEHLRERLAAMAHALQTTLSRSSTCEAVPHAPALEVLMRAIAHDIEGNLPNTDYVKEKLTLGCRKLMDELG